MGGVLGYVIGEMPARIAALVGPIIDYGARNYPRQGRVLASVTDLTCDENRRLGGIYFSELWGSSNTPHRTSSKRRNT